jgi:hypothetical protein
MLSPPLISYSLLSSCPLAPPPHLSKVLISLIILLKACLLHSIFASPTLSIVSSSFYHTSTPSVMYPLYVPISQSYTSSPLPYPHLLSLSPSLLSPFFLPTVSFPPFSLPPSLSPSLSLSLYLSPSLSFSLSHRVIPHVPRRVQRAKPPHIPHGPLQLGSSVPCVCPPRRGLGSGNSEGRIRYLNLCGVGRGVV